MNIEHCVNCLLYTKALYTIYCTPRRHIIYNLLYTKEPHYIQFTVHQGSTSYTIYCTPWRYIIYNLLYTMTPHYIQLCAVCVQCTLTIYCSEINCTVQCRQCTRHCTSLQGKHSTVSTPFSPPIGAVHHLPHARCSIMNSYLFSVLLFCTARCSEFLYD